MESKLTSDEIAELKENLNLLKKLFRQRIPLQLIIIIGALTVGVYLSHGGLFFGGIIALKVSVYINYQITWKWVAQLNSDINTGIKQIREVAIEKVRNKHSFKEFRFNNGIEISELELDEYGIPSSTLKVNDKLTLEFTPKRKHVFNATKTDS